MSGECGECEWEVRAGMGHGGDGDGLGCMCIVSEWFVGGKICWGFGFVDVWWTGGGMQLEGRPSGEEEAERHRVVGRVVSEEGQSGGGAPFVCM